jgi:hypothetical protein
MLANFFIGLLYLVAFFVGLFILSILYYWLFEGKTFKEAVKEIW